MNQQRLPTAIQPTATDPVLVASTPLEEVDIQDWLAQKVGEQLGIAADDIDVRMPFNSYGLQSVQAMAIAETGRQRFGLELSPLVIWNCPTIAALSSHIAQELQNNDHESFEV